MINLTIEEGRFKNHRWIEADSISALRPRLASGIVKLQHTGWYVDDEFQNETTVGIVLRLAHSRGFLAGCSDPWNSSPNKGDIGACLVENYVYADEESAARSADQIAEYYAAECREDADKQREEMRLEDEARKHAEQLENLP